MSGKFKLYHADEKFKNVRNDIPGYSEDLYLLTDYISTVVNSVSVPTGLVVCLLTVIDDIQKGKKGIFGETEFPEKLKQRKKQVLEQIVYIPQIVDEFADKEGVTMIETKRFILRKFNPKNTFMIFVSMVGGFTHTLGQVLSSLLFYQNLNINSIILYSPFILTIGLISGLLIGLITFKLNDIIQKHNLLKIKGETTNE